jgi:hypothetical protein
MKSLLLLVTGGLLALALLLGCGGGGGGNGNGNGGDGRDTSEQAAEAEKIANALIAKDYPEFESVEPQYQGYESGGRQIHEFTYMRTLKIDDNGSIFEIPHNVVVSVDEASSEVAVYESN